MESLKSLKSLKRNKIKKMNKHSFCDVYLIRHGETDWNTEGRLQGHTDIPLNGEGEKQALMLQQKFKRVNFCEVFSSDLSRSRKTAEIVLGAKKIKIKETPILRERYMGMWEGRFAHELRNWLEQNSIISKLSKEEFLSYKSHHNVESYSEVYERVSGFIKMTARSYLNSSILLFSHGGVLRSMLYVLDSNTEIKWQISNCAFMKLRVYEDGLISLMEHEGLKPILDTTVVF